MFLSYLSFILFKYYAIKGKFLFLAPFCQFCSHSSHLSLHFLLKYLKKYLSYKASVPLHEGIGQVAVNFYSNCSGSKRNPGSSGSVSTSSAGWSENLFPGRIVISTGDTNSRAGSGSPIVAIKYRPS